MYSLESPHPLFDALRRLEQEKVALPFFTVEKKLFDRTGETFFILKKIPVNGEIIPSISIGIEGVTGMQDTKECWWLPEPKQFLPENEKVCPSQLADVRAQVILMVLTGQIKI